VQLGQQQGLPNNTVLEAYAMKKAAEEKAAILHRDEALSNEQRQTALVSIQAETERALTGVLGANAFDVYRKGSGEMDPKIRTTT
jgi:hypothetical protein